MSRIVSLATHVTTTTTTDDARSRVRRPPDHRDYERGAAGDGGAGDRSRTVGASRAVAASLRPGRTASHACSHLLQGSATRHKPLRLIIAAVSETPADGRGLSPCRSPDLLEELVTPSALDHHAPICGRPHDGPCDLGWSCEGREAIPNRRLECLADLVTTGRSFGVHRLGGRRAGAD